MDHVASMLQILKVYEHQELILRSSSSHTQRGPSQNRSYKTVAFSDWHWPKTITQLKSKVETNDMKSRSSELDIHKFDEFSRTAAPLARV